MKTRSNLTIKILRFRLPGEIAFTALPQATYKNLFLSLFPSLKPSALNFLKPKEITITSDMKKLGSDINSGLSKAKTENSFLIIEIIDKTPNQHVYDDLCISIDSVITKWSTGRLSIAIITPNVESFSGSILLIHRLVKTCEERKIGLLLIPTNPDEKVAILVRGNIPPSWRPRAFNPSSISELKLSSPRLPAEQIKAEFQLLFDHFELVLHGRTFHIPAVASVRRLVQNDTFINQLRQDIADKFSDSRFDIYPLGIAGGGIEELAVALSGGDHQRVIFSGQRSTHRDRPVLILCDFLSPIYGFPEIIAGLRQKEAKSIGIAGIAKYLDFDRPEEIPCIYYFETTYTASVVDKRGNSPCPFCKQGVPFFSGENFVDFEKSILHFEPFTFWEFIRQDERFYSAGHWTGGRTVNHYQFRIMTKPCFEQFSYSLAIRFRNILKSESIIPQWVKKIVCTEGEESSTLAKSLAEVFGLSSTDVISIPREYFKSIAGKDLGVELVNHMKRSLEKEDSLNRRTVLIVDQAAHHFKTLSALRRICEYYDCVVLAFAVFIDRADTSLIGEYLYNSHYVSLYSWPSQPRLPDECPCRQKERMTC